MRVKRLSLLIITLITSLLIAGCSLSAVTVISVPQTGSLQGETSADATIGTAATTRETDEQTTTAEATTTAAGTTAAVTESSTQSTTHKTTAKPTGSTATSSGLPYYLYADKSSYTLVAYGKDAAGQYTQVVRIMRMAIGRGSMTPTGKFKLGDRYSWYYFNVVDEYTQFAVSYNSDLKIHGPLYSERNNTTMINDSYTQIGTKSTAGCLRMAARDAYWIFSNCPRGTTLEIVSSSTRGFTAPALVPIAISGQDPTDPNLAPPPSPTPTTAETTTATTAAETTDTTASSASETPSPTPTLPPDDATTTGS